MNKEVEMMTPSFSGDELFYIKRALDKNEISITGENIDELKELVLSYTGMPYGVLLGNGTAGLHLAMKALDVSDGDYVFCQSMTYCGSAYPILYERAVPVFIDSKEDGTMDEKSLEAALIKYKDRLPKAAVIVDTYGSPADYGKLVPLLEAYGVSSIEDSAEAIGGTYNGRKLGTFCDISVYSFSYSKLITTSLGGMSLTHSPEYAERMEYLSNQAKAKSPVYIHKEIGYNYSMSNVLAGLGIPGMKNIEKGIARKKEIFEKYKEGFKDLEGVTLAGDREGSSHWQNGIILSFPAKDLLDFLLSKGIKARAGFNPMHRQEAFKGFDFVSAQGDICTGLFERTVLLPSGTGMTDEQQEYVIGTVREFIRRI